MYLMRATLQVPYILLVVRLLDWIVRRIMITKHPHTYRHIYTHVPMTYTQLGSTALHFAVDGDHEEVVELLLKANIDPDLPAKVMQ